MFSVLQGSRGVGQSELERLQCCGRFCERGGELPFASGEPLGRGSGACRPVLPGPFERPFGFAHVLRERIAGRSALRSLRVYCA